VLVWKTTGPSCQSAAASHSYLLGLKLTSLGEERVDRSEERDPWEDSDGCEGNEGRCECGGGRCVRIGNWVVEAGKEGCGELSDGEVNDGGGCGCGCVGKEDGRPLDGVVVEEAPGEMGDIEVDIGEGVYV